VQTSGPDREFGSNEILLSSDQTIAIIDGSGVLADPTGINREELVCSATSKISVGYFDTSKLSKDDYPIKANSLRYSTPFLRGDSRRQTSVIVRT